MRTTWNPVHQPPCSYPPDCPYAGGPGMCHHADNRTPRELHDLWSHCFGIAVANELLMEWIVSTAEQIVTCERLARQSTSDEPWAEMACRFRQQLRDLRAVRTPAVPVP